MKLEFFTKENMKHAGYSLIELIVIGLGSGIFYIIDHNYMGYKELLVVCLLTLVVTIGIIWAIFKNNWRVNIFKLVGSFFGGIGVSSLLYLFNHEISFCIVMLAVFVFIIFELVAWISFLKNSDSS